MLIFLLTKNMPKVNPIKLDFFEIKLWKQFWIQYPGIYFDMFKY